jgi:hypothetical protein
MVDEVRTLPSWEKGVFIGGWKSGRWKHLVTKFGGAELQAGWSSGRPGAAGLQTG